MPDNNEWPFVIAAYAVTWVVLAGYALYLRAVARRARETQGGALAAAEHARGRVP